MSYQYSSLTAAIADKNCPLRQHLDQRFGNHKPVQADYRASAGTLLVDGATASPGTLGAAFDFLLRFTLDPHYVPRPAIIAEPILSRPEYVAAVEDVAKLAGTAAQRPLPEDALTTVIRACWALALCTELYRNPFVFPNSPLAEPIRSGIFTASTLLSLAPTDAITQVRSLYTIAATELNHFLSTPTAVTLGPTFAASRLCAADADLIVDGVLIEVKTRLGAANRKTGQRSDSLSLADIYQIVGYALFDTDDTFGVHTVALYSARYGALHQWPLQRLLEILAGKPVDIAAERADVWNLLAADSRTAAV
ncbi:hypothetical protein [Nocardia paucivorans]|uniref:hypothetical protein n=1 Tax=Nocardia paucivorans TaxID=114259 RepID=UPI0012F8B4B9|nr:hypothetical protein [Nocardia paucivorans]